jgi:hypothetical protein
MQPHLPSLILLSAALGVSGCSAKVELGDAGSTGGAGSTGDAGSLKPTTYQRLVNARVTGIDVLLMIDNSSSMADKQATLAAAVPQLLGQLVAPNCVDAAGNSLNPPVQASLGAAQPCPTGSRPEFDPVNNIHIGIVTSSLGDHGASTICTPGAQTQYTDTNGNNILQPADVNDKGHLMGTLDRGAAAIAGDPQSAHATIDSQGFLAWGDPSLPTTITAGDLTAGTKIFQDMVSATHEIGCGYEASLEGWFRFLIDPVPPNMPIVKTGSSTERTGSDDVLLNQRAQFLRPDSLVAIVMLTDENDCSIRDTDVGWVSADTSNQIPTSSAACRTNPNDKCCYSCTASPPSGCVNGCPSPVTTAVDDGPYQASVRCWQQKRRFGYEFLYPKSRYVVGLTKTMLCPDQSFGDMDCDCTYAKSIGANCNPGSRQMPNPLFSTTVGTLNNGQTIAGYPKAIPRTDNSEIFLAGIVGVPWQDIGTTASGTLRYIPVTDPAWTSAGAGTMPDNPSNASIWDMIYGDDNANIAPADVHMVESLTPRPGLPGPTAAANADPFNGHEYNTARGDFEYACIYPLPSPRACACTSGSANYASCKYQNPNDCCDLSYPADASGGPGDNYNKPECNGTTQVAAKAYPGLREIAVLHDYALTPVVGMTQGNSIVASICPRDLTSDKSSPGYGYNPAVQSMVARMKAELAPPCLPTPLSINADGSTPCNVVEVVSNDRLNGPDCSAYCQSIGRNVGTAAVPASIVADVTAAMQNAKICDAIGQPACSSLCVCQLPQETGANLTACQNATDGTENLIPPGFCYVDPDRGAGSNPDIVASCPRAARQLIRYAGNNPTGGSGVAVPLPGSFVFLSCGTNVN